MELLLFSLCLVPGLSICSLKERLEAPLSRSPSHGNSSPQLSEVSLSGVELSNIKPGCHPPRSAARKDHLSPVLVITYVPPGFCALEHQGGFGLRAGDLSSLLLLQVNTRPAPCLQAPSSHRHSTWRRPRSRLRSGTQQARRSTTVSVTCTTGMPTLPSSFMTLPTR